MFKKISFLFFLSLFFWSFAQKTDSLQIDFPAKYKLKLASSQQNMQIKMLEYIPENENWENYSIIVTKLIMKNTANIPLETVYQSHIKVAQEKTENLDIKEISRNKSGENEFILFTAESDGYKDSDIPESQVYYFVKGSKDIIMCIAAIKAKKLPSEFIDEWSNIFLKSRIIK
ncbi:hypothetical protein [Chryseobacterium sp.]|uniref:hypothetical protein n=1 Tax=Chryseobacterium sp. TaxID=1871047 RepID=UPI00289CFAED|nr:hypothetical protein [Chryseobacterium sp.]